MCGTHQRSVDATEIHHERGVIARPRVGVLRPEFALEARLRATCHHVELGVFNVHELGTVDVDERRISLARGGRECQLIDVVSDRLT